MSLNTPTDAGFACNIGAVLREATKGTPVEKLVHSDR
jgi:hypothetical protein